MTAARCSCYLALSTVVLLLGAGCAADPCKDDPASCKTMGPAPSVDCTGRCGGTCSKCADGKACATATDCQSGVCEAGLCQVPSCTDLVQNGSESDADCGGICGPCALGKACAQAPDCQSGYCQVGKCVSPSCTDGVKNGDESDMDCGGACGKCADGRTCGKAADCQSGQCGAGLCAESPSFMSVAPATGPTTGGIEIIITGQNFVAGPLLSVKVGGVPALLPKVVSATKISATLPEKLGTRGAVDVVVTNGNGLAVTAPHAFSYYIGLIDFKAPLSQLIDNVPTGLAMFDADGDGKLDMVVSAWGGEMDYYPLEMRVHLGQGDGTFGAPIVSDVSAAYSPVGLSFARGDLDGDGVADLVVPSSYDYELNLYTSNGDGTFNVMTNIDLPSSPNTVVAGDFDGDGNQDLIISEWDPFGSFAGLEVMLLDGGGGVNSDNQLPVGSHLTHLAAADLNADGNLDLVTTDSDNNQVWVLLGHGDGSFDSEVGYDVAAGPVHVLVQDLDGDGKADLAVSAQQDNKLSVLLGQGDGTFGTAKSYSAGSLTQFSATGDFDGDGKLNLAVVSGGALTLSVLLGTGGGNFAAPKDIDTGFFSAAVYTADLNSDNKPDVVLFNPGSQKFSVLLNNCR